MIAAGSVVALMFFSFQAARAMLQRIGRERFIPLDEVRPGLYWAKSALDAGGKYYLVEVVSTYQHITSVKMVPALQTILTKDGTVWKLEDWRYITRVEPVGELLTTA